MRYMRLISWTLRSGSEQPPPPVLYDLPYQSNFYIVMCLHGFCDTLTPLTCLISSIIQVPFFLQNFKLFNGHTWVAKVTYRPHPCLEGSIKYMPFQPGISQFLEKISVVRIRPNRKYLQVRSRIRIRNWFRIGFRILIWIQVKFCFQLTNTKL
jgi:hypothetical protein